MAVGDKCKVPSGGVFAKKIGAEINISSRTDVQNV